MHRNKSSPRPPPREGAFYALRSEPMLGDVMFFTRTGGGHVGMYIGEDKDCYHIAGGNQSNQFNIIRIAKNRLTQARRPKTQKHEKIPFGSLGKHQPKRKVKLGWEE